jgi:hypothetical protein
MHRRDSIFQEEEEVSQVRLVARFSYQPGTIALTPFLWMDRRPNLWAAGLWVPQAKWR